MAKNNKTSKPNKTVKSTSKVNIEKSNSKISDSKIENKLNSNKTLENPSSNLINQATLLPKSSDKVTKTQDSSVKDVSGVGNITDSLKDPSFQKKLFALVAGIVFVGLCLGLSFVYIPYLLDNTDEAIATRTKKENEGKTKAETDQKITKLAAETTTLKIDSTTDWKISMEVKDFGTIKLNLKKEYAPATVENFVRLVSRKFYDGNRPHRIVKVNNFTVLQGGDPKEDGTGGETASGKSVPDEIWLDGQAPKYKASGNTQVLENTPQLRAPSLYADFKAESGQITYRKGLILMAKTSSPNSATSQYFITLDTTVLPADYTVFGTVESESLSVLDAITAKVNPALAEGANPSTGGKPNPELTTTSVKITSQS